MHALTRSGFVGALFAAAIVMTAPPAEARRNVAAEQYVQTHASEALRALSAADRSPAQRRQEFGRLMSRFADMRYISIYVLSLQYARELQANPTLRDEWMGVFRDFALARYETEFDRYRGEGVRVINSNETVAGRRAEVLTEFAPPPGESRPMRVRWRLNINNGSYTVINVAIVGESGDLWLADFQRDVFAAELDRNGGDIRALMATVRNLTTEMRTARRRS